MSYTTPYDSIFADASKKYGVDYDLLRAVAKTESGFNSDAVSGVGAVGIMQLMPSTARELGVTDRYNAEQNINGGAMYLSQLLDKYGGDTDKALAAYNTGMGTVDKKGITSAGQKYINSVNANYQTITAGSSAENTGYFDGLKERWDYYTNITREGGLIWTVTKTGLIIILVALCVFFFIKTIGGNPVNTAESVIKKIGEIPIREG